MFSREAARQPDILITRVRARPQLWWKPKCCLQSASRADARSRLWASCLGENGKPILSSVAVSLPVALRDHEGRYAGGCAEA